MRQSLRIALDLLLEASRRRWFLALFGGVTLVLALLGVSLQLDVVDGALTGSKLFGVLLSDEIVTADRALQPVLLAVSHLAFYGGALFMVVACSDFATELLAPGRIEHLLSLPIARWQLLFGTYAGVVVLAGLGTLYGSVGLFLLIGLKTGLWSWQLVAGSGIGWFGFCAIYSAMLTAAVFVRSAALSAGAGVLTVGFGVFASFREPLAALMTAGPGRSLFEWSLLPFPRLATLSVTAARLAAGQAFDGDALWRLLLGCWLFALSLLFLAAFRLEYRDF